MLDSNLLVLLLVLFVCAQPVFWLVALHRFKKYINLRLRRIEAKIDLINDCLGIENENDNELAVVRDLVNANLKLEAIEMFCEQTGANLSEAQRAIRAIEQGQL
ncbi:MAG TPA: hypothetical protein IGS37_03650 [Synechococcales cyanobacterium M55_K2018_004]|nr:hypothetical protein [Synechococcales cyanobacterium M55_K2018_004]